MASFLLPDNLFLQHQRRRRHRGPVETQVCTARKDKIVLVNASARVKKGRPKNYIPEEDIRPLAAAFAKGEPGRG